MTQQYAKVSVGKPEGSSQTDTNPHPPARASAESAAKKHPQASSDVHVQMTTTSTRPRSQSQPRTSPTTTTNNITDCPHKPSTSALEVGDRSTIEGASTTRTPLHEDRRGRRSHSATHSDTHPDTHPDTHHEAHPEMYRKVHRKQDQGQDPNADHSAQRETQVGGRDWLSQSSKQDAAANNLGASPIADDETRINQDHISFHNYGSSSNNSDDDDDADDQGKRKSKGDQRHEIDQPLKSQNVSLWDYIDLLVRSPTFRAYFISSTCMHVGDWFVQIASLLVVEELVDEADRGKALGTLVVWTFLPKPCFAPIGGILADTFDRRNLMIIMDTLSGLVTIGFLVAIAQRSLMGVFVITGMRSSLQSMYYPATTGILPLLVPSPRDLHMAASMNGFAWSLMAFFGGILAGAASAKLGLQACYIIDSATYFLSALIVFFGIRGRSYAAVPSAPSGSRASFSIIAASSGIHNHSDTDVHVDAADSEFDIDKDGIMATKNKPTFHTSRLRAIVSTVRITAHQAWTTTTTVLLYLWQCGFGFNTMLHPCADAVWAPESIIAVSFSTVEGDEARTSLHMGIFYTTLGLGCLVGPILANAAGFTDAKRPITLQRSVIFAMALSTASWLCIATMANSFEMFIVFNFFRTMGSGINWINSTLILQTLADGPILGRVLAVEFAASNLLHALVAHWTGQLEDAGWNGHELAGFGAAIGGCMMTIWSVYHYVFKAGAARDQFNLYGKALGDDSERDGENGENDDEAFATPPRRDGIDGQML